ncbi:MAG TPA: SUMF1/EgtB/PvdO family nonheme iron enzyme, partial [Phototrophicaceae bacterium]|nr:SUMF1/EgtB/PvdO family nonheme iron enzyme [Phototrophicaceae bacterium]
QKWWDEIQQQIERCEGFLYLLSPESISSQYCQKELALAQALGKQIFPALIQSKVVIPDALQDYHAIDLTGGLNSRTVKALLNAIYVAERMPVRRVPVQPVAPTYSLVALEAVNTVTLINEVGGALEAGNFDQAVFLLKQFKESGYASRFIDLEAILHEAEDALEHQAYLREAEREYRPIVSLVQRTRTRHLGLQAFAGFHKQFPDYDPENLLEYCEFTTLYALEWCCIPAGKVTLRREVGNTTHSVSTFCISKYPITNDQFKVFVEASDGYRDDRWWNYSPDARDWHHTHLEPLPIPDGRGNLPSVNVCWHEAMAYCRWLSVQTGLNVTLPTEQQWQRAAQGDDERQYPWGDEFEVAYCNTYESRCREATPVNHYPAGVSPYGVFDMVGNVWEWCLNTERGSLDENRSDERVVRGGSYISGAERSRTTSYFHLNPLCRYDTIGFRIVHD